MSPEVNGKSSTDVIPSSANGLHLELFQLEFLTRYPNSKMGVLSPWRRFLFDPKGRKGFYDFIRTVHKESQRLGAHTDERQIVNADIEKQLNDIFGKRCFVKICKPEDHNLLRHSDGSYSVAMLYKSDSEKPTVYISELLLRSQDGNIQTKLHYQTALCEMIVGLILSREKLISHPEKASSKLVRALCKQLLTREEKDNFENRCAVVMYTFSLVNLAGFLKRPNTLTWIPSLESIIRGGKSSFQDAQKSGYSVAIAWSIIKEFRREEFRNSFNLLVTLSEQNLISRETKRKTLVNDHDLREGAVAAKYVAQFTGIRNPVQTCEAALYSAFSLDTINALKSKYNLNISPRAEALLNAYHVIKSVPFDTSPKLDIDKANHELDYQQALLMQKCIELSELESNDKKFHPSDLLALYFAAKTSEIGTLSDESSSKSYAADLDKEARFTLLPLMERLNVHLFNELGYLLLRAFDHDLTSRTKNRVNLQCAGFNYAQRKGFLSDLLEIAEDIPNCRSEAREKTYYSLSDKHDESVEYVRSFARDYKIKDIDKIINQRIPNEIHNLSGRANHFVDDAVNEIVDDLIRQAKSTLSSDDINDQIKLSETRFDLYKHIFSLIRNTDNLGIRLISPNPQQAIDLFSKSISDVVSQGLYDLVRVNRINKPEGTRVNLEGEWIIDRLEVEVKSKLSDKSVFLEVEVHAMTDSVYRNQKLGLGLFKYAFAHWVMKARRSACRDNKIEESSFKTYSGVIPLQKDPEPLSQLFYQHFDQLAKSLAKHGTYHRIGNEVVLIPSWNSSPDKNLNTGQVLKENLEAAKDAIKATRVYRDEFPSEPLSANATSVYSQIGYYAGLKLSKFQKDFSEFTAEQVEGLLLEEALSRIVTSKVPSESHKHIPENFVLWFQRYYMNIFGLHPLEVCAAFLDDTVIQDAKGNPKTVSQLMMDDLWHRGKNFFAISNATVLKQTEQITYLEVDANADLMGYQKSLFTLRKELAAELNVPVPIIKGLQDRSSKNHPNSQTIAFGPHPDMTAEQYAQFLDLYQKRIKLNFLPLNAKNTKKSTHAERLTISALDTENTLLYLYELAEKHGISIEHNRATTGIDIEGGVPLAKFDMRLRVILKDRDMNSDSSENTQRVRERISGFVDALIAIEDPHLRLNVFSI